MPSGPIVSLPERLIEDSQDRVSFRLILYYVIQTDSIACRLDVKSKDQQHGKAFSVEHRAPKPGDPAERDSPLVEPKGVIAATAIIADRKELLAALRNLADELEKMP